MKVVVPIWHGRISPVFDVAKRLLVVEYEDGTESDRHEEALSEIEFARRAMRVAATGANVLICGAISRPLEGMLASAGIRVIPQVCGQAEVVLGAFLSGQLEGPAFLMPGCRGRRQRGRRRHQVRRGNG